MIDWFASVALMLFGLWFVLAVGLRVLYPLFDRLVKRVPAPQASLLILLYAALPLIASTWLVISLYWPDVARWLVEEHCHSGLCQPHGPVNSLALAPAMLIALLMGWRLLQKFQQLFLPAQRLLRQLRQMGRRQEGYIELPDNQVAAFTVGIIRPEIFLSRGLITRCSPEDIATIVAHEKAHQQRHDNLRRILIGLLLAPLPESWSRRIIESHQLMSEKACDQMAASQYEPESVAELIVKLARWQQATPAHVSAFADCHARLRVEALLRPLPQAEPGLYVLLLFAGIALMWLADPLHHLLERWH